MERKLDSTFRYKKVTLRVVQAQEVNSCQGCYFHSRYGANSYYCEEHEISKITGACNSEERKSGDDVIFVKSEEFEQ